MDGNHSGDNGEERRSSSAGKVLALTAIVMLLAAALGVGLARYGSGLPIIGPLFGESDAIPTSEVGVREIRDLENSATTHGLGSVVAEEAEADAEDSVRAFAETLGFEEVRFG